jgi:uncharacterized repeat protein (TIGR01451 family)
VRLGLVAAILALVAAGALVAAAREPARGAQETGCADPGVVTDYNTFVLGDHRVINDSVDGRMAVGRDAFIQQFGVGNRLSPDASRVDFVVGRNIVSGGNARANNGAVTYGSTLSGQLSALGSIANVAPPFDFAQTFTTLRSAQQSWADLKPNGKVTLPEFNYSPINFTGTATDVNVFKLKATDLQSAQQIQIRVPDRRHQLRHGLAGQRAGTARARDAGRQHALPRDAGGREPRADRTATLPGFGGCLPPPCPPPPTPTPTPTETPTVSPTQTPTVTPTATPTTTPEPTPEPPPLPPDPIPPSPPDNPNPPAPPSGGVLPETADRTVLDLCKKPSRRQLTPGSKVTYRLRIRNVGLPPARRVTVCDPLPQGLRIVRARGARVRSGRACWTVRRLPREKTFHLTARVNQTAAGRITNVASARARNAARVRNPTTIRVRPSRVAGACGAAVARIAC